MGGAATVVCLQQLKGILGLDHFTHGTDLISVMRSVFSQTHQVFLLPFPANYLRNSSKSINLSSFYKINVFKFKLIELIS